MTEGPGPSLLGAGDEVVPAQMPSCPLLLSLALMLATIAAGLAVRLAPLGLPLFVVKYGGSMLWALMVYWSLTQPCTCSDEHVLRGGLQRQWPPSKFMVAVPYCSGEAFKDWKGRRTQKELLLKQVQLQRIVRIRYPIRVTVLFLQSLACPLSTTVDETTY